MGKDANEILLELKAENKILMKKLDDTKKEITGYGKHIEKTSKKMGGFFKRIGKMAIAYLSIRTAKALVDLAGQIDSVGGSFQNLAAGAEGGAEGLLKAMQVASKGTVDNLSIMRSSNLAFQLMGEQVAGHLPKMMEVATAAARAQGKKVADMFQDIVVASGRRSIMILDNLGISSAVAAKYQEEFAASLGKTREQLNEQQKSAAFFYAVMKAGGETIEAVGNEGLTLGEKLQVMEAGTKNVAQTFTKRLMPDLERLADAMLEAGKEGGAFTIILKGVGLAAMVIAKSLTTVVELLNKAVSMGKVSAAEKYQDKAKKAIQDMEKEYTKRYGIMWESVIKGNRTHKAEYDALMKNRAAYKRYTDEVKKFTGESDKVTDRMKKLWTEWGEASDAELQKFLNRERQKTEALTQELTQRDLLQKQAQYEEYIGEYESAELLKKQIEFEKMLEMQVGFQKDEEKIKKAYEKKRLVTENLARKKRLDAETQYFRAKMGMLSIEWQTLKQMTSYSATLMSSNNKKLFKLGKTLAYAQAIMNAAQAITKAWAQGGIYGAALAAIVGAATFVQIGKIRATKMQSYQKGRVPVLADGYVPQDHFPAFIGAKEAVMTKEATLANADLLRTMNKTGQRVGGNVNVEQNINLSGNVMSKDFILDEVLPEFERQARYSGKELFAERTT